MPKPAGLKRVFVAGGAAAVLLGPGGRVPGDAKAGARADVEVINCGINGYGGAPVKDVLGEAVKYSPDLLVVLGDARELPARLQCAGSSGALRRAGYRLLELYYSWKYDPRRASALVSVKIQEAALKASARAAKKAGIPAVFCTLPVNIKDMPPAVPLPLAEQGFAYGYRLFYEKKYQAALDKFSASPAAGAGHAMVNYYIAKTLEKLGRTAEAGPHYLTALSSRLDMSGTAGDRNAMIKRVAAAEGACVADLGALFLRLSWDGLPGFREFTDEAHWRPGYNKAVWGEISRAAGACGLEGLGGPLAPGASEPARLDAAKRLTYAAALVDGKELNEAALAELSYIGEKVPGLLKEAAVSAGALAGLLVRGSGPAPDPAALRMVFPLFLAHLAEADRRAGNYDGALALCKRALFLNPGHAALRLEHAQILAGMGRLKEAESEFTALLDAGDFKEAESLGRAYGVIVSAHKDTDPRLEPEAPPKEKTKGEKLIESCFSPAKEKAARGVALQACQSVVYLSGSGELRDEREAGVLESDASYQSSKLLAALGRAEEAREALLWTVANAPASWPGLAKARREVQEDGSPR